MRPIGIAMHAIGNLTDEEYIRLIKDQGFSATFTDMFATDKQQAELAELLAKHGVFYETLHAPFGHINDIWMDKTEGHEMFRELCDCIDRASAAGVPTVVVHLSSGMNPPSITDIGRARFTCLVDYADRKNVKIAFENQRWLANLSWAMEFFSPDTVGFCWDCGHEHCFTPGRQYMPLFGNRLIALHIHDNSCEYNADDHWLPFDGSINFERIASQIKASDYKGSLMLEVIGTRPRYRAMDTETYISRAAEAAKHLRAMVEGENA
ncbi:MAG: sugar phosphate isomerase/epimerase [Clostridia bacterium]|nr:sugar phosphate isomerase/epimerase [Clostridia bacterium]